MDCPLGEHCALGICDLECREDVDCLDLPGAACDERGRCRGCLSDADCDDGVFCNGVEECAGASAGAIGTCNPGTPPCVGACDEVTRTCDDTSCPDLDMDGFADIRCGGDDCDDDDPDAYPGNTEVCDSEGHDEDCDPDTFGADDDEDGYQSDECCNGDRCGTDCDDDLAGRNPGAVDGCGGGDEDCDGSLDEEPDSIFYRDQDSDNYGVTTDTIAACSLPSGYAAASGDCSDDPFAASNANEINPGATEICDEIDNNCSGVVDDIPSGACACTVPDMERDCGLVDPTRDGVGICRLGLQTCSDGAWTTCVDSVPPTTEDSQPCNSIDEDCDGMVDEGVVTRCYVDTDSDGYAPAGAGSIDSCSCPSGYTARAPVGLDVDCRPMDPNASPARGEQEFTCNGVDNDCDGRVDETAGGPPTNAATWYRDVDGDGHGTDSGSASDRVRACSRPAGYASSDDDCVDTTGDVSHLVYPGATTFHKYGHCDGVSSTSSASCMLGSFDYNCDGSQEQQEECDQTSSGGVALCSPGGRRPWEGELDGFVLCGTMVEYVDCGGCSSFSCRCNPANERLGCR
ncbi:MAG: putative metal-binding motif-containing protein [Deltaproteobacteria bacterium]|nr:putative metal-binding motif-containing protein [Deltaproteobacteria bacterium]